MVLTESTKYLNKLQTILENHGHGLISNKLEAVFKDACNELKRMGSRKIGGKPLREILVTATLKDQAELIEMFGPLFVVDRVLGQDTHGNLVPTCKVKMIKTFPAIIMIELIKMTEAWSLLGEYTPEKKILFKVEIEETEAREFKSAFRSFIAYFSLLPQFVDWVNFKVQLSETQTNILKDKTIVAAQDTKQIEDVGTQQELIPYVHTYPKFSVLVNKNDIIKIAEDYPSGQRPDGFLFMVKEQSGFAYSFLHSKAFSSDNFEKVQHYISKIQPKNNILAVSNQHLETINKIPTLSFSFIIEKDNRFEMIFYNFMQFQNNVVNLMIQTVLDENSLEEIKQLYIKRPLLLSAKKIIETIKPSATNKVLLKNKPKKIRSKSKTYICDEYDFSITVPKTDTVKKATAAIKEGGHKDTLFVVKARDGFFCRILYEGKCNRIPFEPAEAMIEVLRTAPTTIYASTIVKNIINGLEVISFAYCIKEPRTQEMILTSLNFVRIKDRLINFTSNFCCNDDAQIDALLKNPAYPRIMNYIKSIMIRYSPEERQAEEVETQTDDPIAIANAAILRYLIYKERIDMGTANAFIDSLMQYEDLYTEFKNSLNGFTFTVEVENPVIVAGHTALDFFCQGLLSPSAVYQQLISLKSNDTQPNNGVGITHSQQST